MLFKGIVFPKNCMDHAIKGFVNQGIAVPIGIYKSMHDAANNSIRILLVVSINPLASLTLPELL